MQRHPITGTAQIISVETHLLPYRVGEQTHVDERPDLPWAISCIARIRFTIGELTVSKRITQKITFPGHERPADADIEASRLGVLQSTREQIMRHGFDPGQLDAELNEHAPFEGRF